MRGMMGTWKDKHLFKKARCIELVQQDPTQRVCDLAERLGVSTETIRKWLNEEGIERGKT